MTLGRAVARCPGVGEMEDGVMHWREGCADCLRRTSHGLGEVEFWHMNPPKIIAFECEYRIGPQP